MSVVKLRSRPTKNGSKKLLFLDIYPPVRNPDTGKLQRKDYLKIFLFTNPTDKIEWEHNKETLELARCVCAARQLEVQNNRFDFLSQRMRNGSFLEFFMSQLRPKKKSNYEGWRMAIEYFRSFAKGDVKFPEINETFSEEYADYLLSGQGIGRTGRRITMNTAVSYFAKYRGTLKIAFRKRLLSINLYELVQPVSKMLGHKRIETTMIYVKIVDKLKRDASHRIALKLDGSWIGEQEQQLTTHHEMEGSEQKCSAVPYAGLRLFAGRGMSMGSVRFVATWTNCFLVSKQLILFPLAAERIAPLPLGRGLLPLKFLSIKVVVLDPETWFFQWLLQLPEIIVEPEVDFTDGHEGVGLPVEYRIIDNTFHVPVPLKWIIDYQQDIALVLEHPL
ncbi:MAG: hypothetical protein DI535_09985 [Citrobacter freundii]|nr:MAG: hypothetical protein DI535_09985 [Citrobacter freundii]